MKTPSAAPHLFQIKSTSQVTCSHSHACVSRTTWEHGGPKHPLLALLWLWLLETVSKTFRLEGFLPSPSHREHRRSADGTG